MHFVYLDVDRCTEDDAENPPLVLAAYHIPLDLFVEAGIEALRQGEQQQDEIEIIRGGNSFLALLNCCKDVNKQNHSGTTALHVACKRGSTGMVKRLLNKDNSGINRPDNLNNTPLHVACAHGNRQMCKVLIDANAHFKEKNNEGMIPLHVAALAHNQKVVEMIISHEKCIEHIKDLLTEKDNNGHTPFLLAVKSGDVTVVETFIDNNADITVKNNNGANALHLAAMANHTKVLKKLRS